MAVLFMDGFEGNDIAVKYNSSTSPATSTGTVRNAFTGSRSGHGTFAKSYTAATKATFGFGYFPPATGSTEVTLQVFSNGGVSTQLTLNYTVSSGVFVVKRGATTIATGTTALSTGNWYFIEFQCTINASTGTAILHVNGVLDAGINFTGNTANAAFSTTDTVQFIASAAQGGAFDDLYIADGTGGINDDFIGDCRVYPIVPTGAGISTQFTPSSGSNWSNVAGLTVQSANINSDATSGHTDDYVMGDLPSPATGTYLVKAVQACAYASKSDAGGAGFYNDLYIGSTHYQGAAHSLSTSYLTYTDVWDKNPDTGPTAWTVSDVNGLQAGMKVQ